MGDTWSTAISNEDDRKIALSQLILSAEQKWEAHQFDRIVEIIADRIKLTGFDATSYRKLRLPKWQELVKCFESRESAETGIARAIEAELMILFGSQPQV
jgi:hypothetical protein